ncbi:MAG: hypothetical protein PHS93_07665 [Candidatus Omnitrophica bacterium]|nr:hypothetical protein [Candidatus Omnitrophota bacterium]
MKRLLIVLALMLLMGQAWGTVTKYVIVDSDDLTGRLQTADLVYFTARGMTEAETANAGITGVVGQAFTASEYCTYRTIYRFDTSSLSDTDTIDSVRVKIVIDTDNSETNFWVFLCAVQDTVNAAYFNAGLFNRFEGWATGSSVYTPTIISDSTTTLGVTAGDTLSFFFNAAGIAEINKTGTTQFYILSNRDTGAVTSADHEDLLTQDDSPYMEVFYDDGETPVAKHGSYIFP